MPHLKFDGEEDTHATVVISGDQWAIYLRNEGSDEAESVRLIESGHEGVKAAVYACTNGVNYVAVENLNGLILSYRVDSIQHVQSERKV